MHVKAFNSFISLITCGRSVVKLNCVLCIRAEEDLFFIPKYNNFNRCIVSKFPLYNRTKHYTEFQEHRKYHNFHTSYYVYHTTHSYGHVLVSFTVHVIFIILYMEIRGCATIVLLCMHLDWYIS